MLTFDSTNREDAADGEDHAPEALRYGLMSRPGRSEKAKGTEPRQFSPFAEPEERGGFMST